MSTNMRLQVVCTVAAIVVALWADKGLCRSYGVDATRGLVTLQVVGIGEGKPTAVADVLWSRGVRIDRRCV
jgi:hypothetical protein